VETIVGPMFGGLLLSCIGGSSFIIVLTLAAFFTACLFAVSDMGGGRAGALVGREINGFKILFRGPNRVVDCRDIGGFQFCIHALYPVDGADIRASSAQYERDQPRPGPRGVCARYHDGRRLCGRRSKFYGWFQVLHRHRRPRHVLRCRRLCGGQPVRHSCGGPVHMRHGFGFIQCQRDDHSEHGNAGAL
jgi:hypothetical protein